MPKLNWISNEIKNKSRHTLAHTTAPEKNRYQSINRCEFVCWYKQIETSWSSIVSISVRHSSMPKWKIDRLNGKSQCSANEKLTNDIKYKKQKSTNSNNNSSSSITKIALMHDQPKIVHTSFEIWLFFGIYEHCVFSLSHFDCWDILNMNDL